MKNIWFLILLVMFGWNHAVSMTQAAYDAGISTTSPQDRMHVVYNYFHMLRRYQGLHEYDAQLRIQNAYQYNNPDCHAVTWWQPSRNEHGEALPEYPRTYVFLHERVCSEKRFLPFALYVVQHELGHCWQFVVYKRKHGLHPEIADNKLGMKVKYADEHFTGEESLPLCYSELVAQYNQGYTSYEVDADIHALRWADDKPLMKKWIKTGSIPEFCAGYLRNADRLALLE